LRDWLRISWIVEHQSGAQEIAGLLAIVERGLANTKVVGLAEDWCFNIADNAARQAATAALAASGLCAAREQHHYRTVQSRALMIGRSAAEVGRLDRFRKKRNIIGYESAGVMSEREAREMYDLAVVLRDDDLAGLGKHYPKLVKR